MLMSQQVFACTLYGRPQHWNELQNECNAVAVRTIHAAHSFLPVRSIHTYGLEWELSVCHYIPS